MKVEKMSAFGRRLKAAEEKDRQARIGRATEKAFGCGYVQTFDSIWTIYSVEELLKWAEWEDK